MPFEVPAASELAERLALGARGHLPRVQRGLLGDRRRRLDAPGPLRGRAAPRPRSSPGSRRDEPEVHGLVALMEIQASRSGRGSGRDGRADAAARPGPRALGPAADPPRPRRPRPRPGARRRTRPLRAPGRDRRLPRPRAHRRRDRLGAHRRPLRRARPAHRRRRSSSSTARSPWRWPSARPPASRSSTRSADEPSLAAYHLLPSVRGDLLAKLGRHDEARAEFERAASMTRNARERDLLEARAAELGD